MSDHSTEESLRAGLQRWAEGGAPSFDLGGALQRRIRQRQARWRRIGSIAAALLLCSATATITFPAWAASAANLPLIGEPIKAYLAERAGLSWAYEMGFYQANLAELSDGGVTIRVLGVLADPIQTKVFYEILGVDESTKQATPIGSEPPPSPAELSITGISGGMGGVSSYYPISGYNSPDAYYIAETTPIPGERATIHLRLRVGDKVKNVDLPASRSESSRFFTEIPAYASQTHGPVTINLLRLTLSPVEVVATYRTETPPGPDAWSTRGPLPQPYLRSGGRELSGRSVAGFGLNGVEHLAFERVKGAAQLVIPAVATPVRVDAQWLWAPGTTIAVQGVPVRLERISPSARPGEVSVEWSYPADSPLLGLGGITLLGKDGTRLAVKTPGSGGGTEESVAHSHLSVEIPSGFEPAGIEVSHAIWRTDGPWVFDLPPLPNKP
jgi:hypothetical protein